MRIDRYIPFHVSVLKWRRAKVLCNFFVLFAGVFSFLFLFNGRVYGVTITSTTTGGNWNTPGSWQGGVVPGAGKDVVILATAVINVDMNTATVGNITINGGNNSNQGILNVLYNGASYLNYNGDMIVNSGGQLTNHGSITQYGNNKAFKLLGTALYHHDPHNGLDESIFSNSSETFDPGSTLWIQQWASLTVPLGDPTRVESSNFGNVKLSVSDYSIPWEQNGRFMVLPDDVDYRIKGTFTVTDGIISMDNGNGGTTFLQIPTVNITANGCVIFASATVSGTSRPFSLYTGTFTDVSTYSSPTVIMDNCFLPVTWTCTGDITIGHNFYGMNGTAYESVIGGGFTIYNNTGTLTINGGTCSFMHKVNATLNLYTSSTFISGSSTNVSFIEGGSNNLTYSTGSLSITDATVEYVGGTGTPGITIINNLALSGNSKTTIISSSTSTRALALTIGQDFTMSGNAVFTATKANGALTFQTGNNFSIAGGQFIGQATPGVSSAVTFNIGTAPTATFTGFTFNDAASTKTAYCRLNYGNGTTSFTALGSTLGSFNLINSGTTAGLGFTGIYNGSGNFTFKTNASYLQSAGRFAGIYNTSSSVLTGNLIFTTVKDFTMNSGVFRGIDNSAALTNGTIAFTTSNLSFAGGNFIGYNAVNINVYPATFSVTGDCGITYKDGVDNSFTFIGDSSMYITDSTGTHLKVNSQQLKLNITGNLNIGVGALYNGTFMSSVAGETETISVGDSMVLSGGTNSFNPNYTVTNAHMVNLNVASDVIVTGGSNYLSANTAGGTVVDTIKGNLVISGGTLSLQSGNAKGVLNIKGGYSQSNGTFYIYNNSTNPTGTADSVYINYDNDAIGDFSQTGGTINFDNNVTSGNHTINIYSPNFTLGGTGKMTIANASQNTKVGKINLLHTSVNYYHAASSSVNQHTLDNVQLNVGILGVPITLTVASGDLEIGGYDSSFAGYSGLLVNSGSILDLGSHQIFSVNGLGMLRPKAKLFVNGTLRTTNPYGLYDNTTNAAISNTLNMAFSLTGTSTVEYYGSSNQVVTGIGTGFAFGLSCKYGNLKINMGGSANATLPNPASTVYGSRSVYVRTSLILTNGALNLDDDLVSSTGTGRSIVIESSATAAITRNNGYIRSETYDSLGSVYWNIGSTTGSHIIPFGMSSASTDYIPFTYQHTGTGSSDTIIVSTYHTPANNLPLPRPVSAVTMSSANATKTVDRFWFLRVKGAPSTASMTFVATSSEASSISTPRAQRYLPSYYAWESYQSSQSSVGNNSTTYAPVGGVPYFDQNWWTLTDVNTPLPITLVDFTGKCKAKHNELNWSTASEINNAYFTVLRADDGQNFESIGTVNGSGNSHTLKSYTFIDDQNSDAERVFYKLRQTDFDGTESEFGPIAVESCDHAGQLIVSLINQSETQANFIVTSPYDGDFVLTLFGIDGKEIGSANYHLIKGSNLVPFQHASLATGIYMMRVSSMSDVVTKKVFLGY